MKLQSRRRGPLYLEQFDNVTDYQNYIFKHCEAIGLEDRLLHYQHDPFIRGNVKYVKEGLNGVSLQMSRDYDAIYLTLPDRDYSHAMIYIRTPTIHEINQAFNIKSFEKIELL